MNEYLREKISQLIDDELKSDESFELLQKIERQPELNDIMNRYETIHHAIKSKSFISVRSDFATRIQHEIKQDELYKRPQTKATQFLWNQNLIALAASLVIVAVIMVRGTNTVEPSYTQLSKSGSEKIRTIPVKQSDQRPLNAQINDYLQSHNNNGYSNEEAFVRLSSYNRQ